MTRDWMNAGWPIVRIRDIGRLHGGGTPSRKRPEFFHGTIPWITGQDIPESHVAEISTARDYVTDEAVQLSATRVVPPGAVLVTTRVSVGKTAIAGCPICFSQDVTAILIHSAAIALPAYVAHFLRSRRGALLQKNQGSTIAGITRDSLALEQIPLPPLSEQQRIVEILQEAEEICRLRAEAEAKTTELIPRLFISIFGDPGQNPKKWSRHPLSSLAEKYSDGPFGSNLKSSHYTDRGVRVIRLQNIGVGFFLGDDEAFISEGHFAPLAKHGCLPGDVLIGTLGDPNLRACILPKEVGRALNKADCVQFRPDRSKVTAAYVCWLLNMPGTLRMAQSLQAGQTRSRISMGRLAPLSVPCPPLELQMEFEKAVQEILEVEESIRRSSKIEKSLAASLSAHAFSGQLTVDWREAHHDMLELEALDRDAALKEAGGTLTRFRRGTIQEMETVFQDRTDGIYSDLSREQCFLLREINRMVGGVRHARYFSAQQLSNYVSEGPLRRNPQAIEGHLAVFAARGLIIPVSREEQTEDTGEFVFGNAYRLPLDDCDPREGEEGEPRIGDHARLRELERLAAQLQKERALP